MSNNTVSAIESPFKQLSTRFSPEDVEWVIINAFDYSTRDGFAIKAFASPYIKKEVAERTADEVFGPDNWENGYDMPDGAGRIKYWIRFRLSPADPWVYRYDGASINLKADGNLAQEAFEIALTFAEKRCWAKVGVGRYLKLVPHTQVEVSTDWVAGWAQYSFRSKFQKQEYQGKQVPKRIRFYWNPPHLPAGALPPDYEYPAGAPQKPPARKPPPQASEEASAEQWKHIFCYYDNMSEADQGEWDAYLFLEDVDEDSGEVVKKDRKRLSKAYAGKILASLEKGFGKLNDDLIPETLAGRPATELEAEIDRRERAGVTQNDLQDQFGAEPEKK